MLHGTSDALLEAVASLSSICRVDARIVFGSNGGIARVPLRPGFPWLRADSLRVCCSGGDVASASNGYLAPLELREKRGDAAVQES